MKAIILQGNSTGLYPIPAQPRGTALKLGFAVFAGDDNLNNAGFNYSPVPYLLISGLQNPTYGWRIVGASIVDPTRMNWTGYNLVWLYE